MLLICEDGPRERVGRRFKPWGGNRGERSGGWKKSWGRKGELLENDTRDRKTTWAWVQDLGQEGRWLRLLMKCGESGLMWLCKDSGVPKSDGDESRLTDPLSSRTFPVMLQCLQATIQWKRPPTPSPSGSRDSFCVWQSDKWRSGLIL